MICIAFPSHRADGTAGGGRGFLLEKGGKELYSGGRGRGRGGFPCVRNLLDKSLIGKYKNEKTPTRNVASNVSMLARWFCLLILLYFGSEQDRTSYRFVVYVYKNSHFLAYVLFVSSAWSLYASSNEGRLTSKFVLLSAEGTVWGARSKSGVQLDRNSLSGAVETWESKSLYTCSGIRSGHALSRLTVSANVAICLPYIEILIFLTGGSLLIS